MRERSFLINKINRNPNSATPQKYTISGNKKITKSLFE
jgi:hypothetical protein